jgi:hypothetical protein
MYCSEFIGRKTKEELQIKTAQIVSRIQEKQSARFPLVIIL